MTSVWDLPVLMTGCKSRTWKIRIQWGNADRSHEVSMNNKQALEQTSNSVCTVGTPQMNSFIVWFYQELLLWNVSHYLNSRTSPPITSWHCNYNLISSEPRPWPGQENSSSPILIFSYSLTPRILTYSYSHTEPFSSGIDAKSLPIIPC